ncbi:probable histone-lysine N-methyltransferase CG1716 [Microplitis demolitor]|uniref:probable histone-lysine N-methyltransferase CG1716 n=1 Tax=Microplitis demolitor TaxID=69319 RepID=UPI0004CCB5A7|nr:probable histone-lysine N-methyltransferase CG1716 [Microplitis demolitor]XP_053596585.1 probable histone-lysine N-methyltransferase CG1716 [Microplitis demolitor]
MARRKKSDTGATQKPANPVPVRKSTRQSARRLSADDKKVNGDVSQPTAAARDDNQLSSGNNDDSATLLPIKVKKKRGRKPLNRNKVNNEAAGVNSTQDSAQSIASKDQDEVTIVAEFEGHGLQSKKVDDNEDDDDDDVVVIGENSNVMTDVDDSSHMLWNDGEVIEETIICEEMEVEDGRYDDNNDMEDCIDASVVLEQVLLVNEQNYEGKEVVEFTVIQNEDGTESMVMTSEDNRYESSEYADDVTCLSNDNDQVLVEDDQVLVEDDQVLAEDNKVLAEDDQMLAEDNKVLAENDQVLADDDQVLAEDDKVLAENDQIIAEDEVLAEDDQVLSKIDEISIKDDQVSMEDNSVSPKDDQVSLKNDDDKAPAKDDEIVTKNDEISSTDDVVLTEDVVSAKDDPVKPADDVITIRNNVVLAKEDKQLSENNVNVDDKVVANDNDSKSSDKSDITNEKTSSVNNTKVKLSKPSEISDKSSVIEAIIADASRVSSPSSPVVAENGTSDSSSSNPVTFKRKRGRPRKEHSISPSELEKSLATITINEVPKDTSVDMIDVSKSSGDVSNSNNDSSLVINKSESLPSEPTQPPTEEIVPANDSSSVIVKPDDVVVGEEKLSSAFKEEIEVTEIRVLDRTPTPTDGFKQNKTIDRPQSVEELSRESGMDVKTDSDDVKLSSSSENSNDTSVSLNGIKLPEFGDKTAAISASEGDKKVGFRSRSGSTDTTGSESGSNSSTVRRSSRIRSQGLMNKRSRGRGLVTKPVADLLKIPSQDREKLQAINVPAVQALRDTMDSQSETQSDKENSIKAPLSEFNSVASSSITGYDSDSTKPVKVKSRWRRSSELEMGHVGSRLAFGGLTAAPTTSESSNSLATVSENVATSIPLFPSGSRDVDSIKDSTVNSNNSSPVPSIIQPAVPEERDKEIEDRLSQFEYLKENLYLTERYTNKETKRMVCDCFLTEEEVERGELGCGEDCLNRLLMIECGSRCVVSDRCTNRRFQSCSYAKCEVFRTDKKGLGLRATADLDAGEFIMEYVGEVVDPKDFRKRAKEYSKDKNKHYYFMALKSDQIIDATMKGNISRFINHSCDPNAETQKWTVNGELRIGFFNRRFIAAGEEITFDYHFQRYGKEAQKCFCESTNCRGWIGETPEEENEKIEKKETRERERDRDVKKKREVKKVYVEDEDLEEEIDKLCMGGLKNRAHTLMLSRLMVRSREIEHRTRLLKLIQCGEQPCRRLFLDYHGLRLMWSYMMDVANLETEEAQMFRLELLKTLSTLPIPNKTMLMDSKVYSVVQKWSDQQYLSPKPESPEEEVDKDKDKDKEKEKEKEKVKVVEEVEGNCDSNDKSTNEGTAGQVNKKTDKAEKESEVTSGDASPAGPDHVKSIQEFAANLLNDWLSLKEVFRIPKKERIEQMKEHEREADSGYREDLKKEAKESSSAYDRRRTDRYDRRRGRDSPDDNNHRKDNKRTNDDRGNGGPSMPRLSKYERRQLFALKVAKEEEERLRRQQQEMWQEHEARCHGLGMDPHTTAAVDPQTGYPLFFNPTLGQWQSYPLQESQHPDMFMNNHRVMPIPNQNPHPLPPNLPSEIPPGMPPPPYGMPQPPVPYNVVPNLAHPPQPQPFPPDVHLLPSNLMPVHNGSTPPLPIPPPHVFIDKPVEQQFTPTPMETVEETPEPPVQQIIELPPIDLPPKWKCAKDARGRCYFYHVKERIAQWLPPPPVHIGAPHDTSSSEESSEESSSSEEEVDDLDDDDDHDDTELLRGVLEQMKIPTKQNPRGTAAVPSEPKKRRDGLVQERIISPRREEKVDHRKYKEIKEKQRRHKERAKLKEQMEKLKKHRRANKAKYHARHTAIKLQAIAESNELTTERKIKDTFRINMANVIVRFLNPFRQHDCKHGRITNTEDFKYLARKLTHFVLAKELKHCKSVDELQCNENVKHKAKDFVRKYMGKFGPVYQRSSDED